MYSLCLALIVVAGLASCGVEDRDRERVNEQQSIYERVQPVPRFDWSQDRDTLIQIYRSKNDAIATWTIVSSLTGQVVWQCPSKGYPLPADTQLTNPLRSSGSGVAIEQAEPNGLFSSKNTDATYILCIRPSGEIVPVYTELKASTFPFAVHIENGTVIDEGGAATFRVTVRGQ